MAYDPFLPADQRPPVRLEGEGVVLREWQEADLDDMAALLDDAAIAHRTPLPTPFGAAEARARLDRARAGGPLFLAVTLDGGRALGEVLLMPRGALGYLLGEAHRGQGLAARALRLLADHAAGELGLRELVLEIEVDNAPSQAVAQRAGFARTGASEVVEDKGRPVHLEVWRRGA